MKKPAFTLIEMMVSIVITLLLTGGSLVYFNEFRARQDLNAAVVEILSGLKLARNYAVTLQKPSGRVDDLTEVLVEIYTSGSEKKIRVSDGESPANLYFDKMISNNNNITITNNCGDFNFAAFTGNSSCNDTIVVSMTNEATDSTTIIVKSSGLVYAD